MSEDALDFIHKTYELAKSSIEEKRGQPQTFFMFNDKKELAIVLTPWEAGNYAERANALAAARLFAIAHRTTKIVFVSEIWVSHANPDGTRPSDEPRNDPNRREALLFISAAHAPGQDHHFTADIDRTGESPRVGPLENFPGESQDNIVRPTLPPKALIDDMPEGMGEAMMEQFQRDPESLQRMIRQLDLTVRAMRETGTSPEEAVAAAMTARGAAN